MVASQEASGEANVFRVRLINLQRSKFYRRVEEDDWRFSNITAMEYFFGRKGNFKLANMYHELVNGEFDAHRAQADGEALLQVCLAFGKDFLDYADKNRAEFPFLTTKHASWRDEFLNRLKGSSGECTTSSKNTDD